MKKTLKEILISPGMLIFFCGSAIAILGWLWIELFDKERIKEIKIVKGE